MKWVSSKIGKKFKYLSYFLGSALSHNDGMTTQALDLYTSSTEHLALQIKSSPRVDMMTKKKF